VSKERSKEQNRRIDKEEAGRREKKKKRERERVR
jgi:hypothetical protein